jgi:glycosyltransferase involved in cell wall biosynthesis
MPKKSNDILLHIAILTYNHENFIEECVLSVLNQNVDFKYCITILDDCSTDKTKEILQKLKNKVTETIELVFNETNLGPLKSAIKLSSYFNAKYITWLDGDDYWSDNNKLQQQIDFMEQNPDYAGCFHDAKIIHRQNSDNEDFLKRTQSAWRTYSQFNRYQPEFMPWMALERNIIPTASLVFRYFNLSKFIENFKQNELSLSWAIHLEIIKNSKLKYFNECWSVYNDHPLGISKKYDIIEFKQNNISILEGLLTDKDWRYYYADIYRSICNEFRYMLKTTDTLLLPKVKFRKLLKTYSKYRKLLTNSEIIQLKEDFINVRNNGMVEN